ncbi:hypothetical protein [Nostoc sp.]
MTTNPFSDAKGKIEDISRFVGRKDELNAIAFTRQAFSDAVKQWKQQEKLPVRIDV